MRRHLRLLRCVLTGHEWHMVWAPGTETSHRPYVRCSHCGGTALT